MLAKLKSKEFFSFILAGGFAALVNFGSRFIYSHSMSYGNSVLLAYLTGMITAFILSKLFVFDKSIHSAYKEFFYFTLVNIVALIQTYVISVGLAEYLFPYLDFCFHPHAVAHAIGVMFPVFSSYFGHKFFTFKVDNG